MLQSAGGKRPGLWRVRRGLTSCQRQRRVSHGKTAKKGSRPRGREQAGTFTTTETAILTEKLKATNRCESPRRTTTQSTSRRCVFAEFSAVTASLTLPTAC